jgi:dTDP-4-amino-4,6-dideoxygalactose transaminase
MNIPFGDLRRQAESIGLELNEALARVAANGWYVLGNEVRAFEEEFAAVCGAAQCISVASGFDALYLALAALEVGPGDEVITVANTTCYEVAAILQTGARPVLVEIDPQSHNLDPEQLAGAITAHTKAIIAVHLYGKLAAMPAIMAIADQYGIPVVEDACQAHGAFADDRGVQRRAGNWGQIGCFSFYPSKNLGALGDGGALTTNDPALAERLRRLRFYGWSEKYIVSEQGGRNSRLDEIQAAVLRVKLRYLAQWNAARVERATWYREGLAGLPIGLPAEDPGHVYHLFVITTEQREGLRQHLRENGVATDVHYPVPAHLQPAYQQLGYGPGSLPITEKQAQQILSLPIYPELTDTEVARVIAVVRSFFS